MLSHIKRVDIEIQSYCNRTCAWCPNASIDRLHKTEMSDETYTKILNDLKEGNFGSNQSFIDKRLTLTPDPMERRRTGTLPYTISFLGFQEPLSNPELLKRRVKQAWDILPPKVEFISNTNGDFLTKESLENLLLTSLSIMDYDDKGINYWKDKMTKAGVVVADIDYDREIIYGLHRYIGLVKCICNWKKNWRIEDRAGYLKRSDMPLEITWKKDLQERTVPCVEPSEYINLSYSGEIMACCHARFENPHHKGFILGNVNETSISSAHYSAKANELKEMLLSGTSFPESCRYCQKVR